MKYLPTTFYIVAICSLLFLVAKNVQAEAQSSPQTLSLLAAIAGTIAAIAAMISARVAYLNSQNQIRSAQKIAEQQSQTALAIAKQQIQAEMVAANRHAWIHSVQNHLSQFFSHMRKIAIEYDDMPKTLESLKQRGKWAQKSATKMQFMLTNLSLMLNPDNPAHNALVAQINDLINLVHKMLHPKNPATMADFNEAILKATDLGREVLSNELAIARKGE